MRRLSLVLHTHMPYVEGFGTWPFGEEWLWEALATCYLPLLRTLDAHSGRVTLSVTPVLTDQLAVAGLGERLLAFLEGVREDSHRLDLEARPELAAQLEASRDRYRRAAGELRRRGGDLVAALAPHVTWTSSATHAVLPLLATDAGLRQQVRTGMDAHRARFPRAPAGGFWLPECAHAAGLDGLLGEEGVTHVCVELTDLGRDPRTPLRSSRGGPVLFPVDRALIDRVWGRAGYPSQAPYLATHRFTPRRHLAWAVNGVPYDADRAAAQVRADAADFLARVPAGGHTVVAFDTELLGHFWPEGIGWLEAVLGGAEEAGVELRPLGLDALERAPERAPGLPVTSWGHPRTLATWSAPPARGLAWRQRAAELRLVAARGAADARAWRELLALQSSDWAFLVTHGTAGPYPLERAAGHERALAAALEAPGTLDPALRGLAPTLRPAVA